MQEIDLDVFFKDTVSNGKILSDGTTTCTDDFSYCQSVRKYELLPLTQDKFATL